MTVAPSEQVASLPRNALRCLIDDLAAIGEKERPGIALCGSCIRLHNVTLCNWDRQQGPAAIALSSDHQRLTVSSQRRHTVKVLRHNLHLLLPQFVQRQAPAPILLGCQRQMSIGKQRKQPEVLQPLGQSPWLFTLDVGQVDLPAIVLLRSDQQALFARQIARLIGSVRTAGAARTSPSRLSTRSS